jgi:hypothetical protein
VGRTDIFERVRHWRWAVVIGGTAALAAVPVVAANWPVPVVVADVDELTVAVLESDLEPYVGLVDSRGGLRLPDLGRYDDEVAPFASQTRSRIWYDGPTLWRASELLIGGERGTYREPDLLWTWDSGDRDVEQSPRQGDEPLRLPRVMDLAPPELGRRLLAEASQSGLQIDSIAPRRIAGHIGAGLRFEPPTDSPTTIEAVELWAQPTTGLVLRVDIYTSAGPPIFETAFVDLDNVAPAADAVRFPADDIDPGRIDRTPSDPIEVLSGVPFARLPDRLGGLARRNPSDQGVATYGSALEQVTVVAAPSGSLGRRIARLPRSTRPWGGEAVLVGTSLVNAQLVTVGGLDIIVAGTVTVAELDRLVGALRAELGVDSALGSGAGG